MYCCECPSTKKHLSHLSDKQWRETNKLQLEKEDELMERVYIRNHDCPEPLAKYKEIIFRGNLFNLVVNHRIKL